MPAGRYYYPGQQRGISLIREQAGVHGERFYLPLSPMHAPWVFRQEGPTILRAGECRGRCSRELERWFGFKSNVPCRMVVMLRLLCP